jgi:hypothetical protein
MVTAVKAKLLMLYVRIMITLTLLDTMEDAMLGTPFTTKVKNL